MLRSAAMHGGVSMAGRVNAASIDIGNSIALAIINMAG